MFACGTSGCRIVPDLEHCFVFMLQEDSLWACLAAMAAYSKELATAEVAYAAIDEVRTYLLQLF